MNLHANLNATHKIVPALGNQAWLRALERTAPIARQPSRTLPVVIEELAETFGAMPALLSHAQSLTYRELAQISNQYSRWALQQKIGVGDCVCLLMPNRPDFMAIWLGVSRIGGVVSLLNTSLRAQSLAHCITTVRPRHLIVDATLLDAFRSAQPDLASDIECWVHGADEPRFVRIDQEVCQYSGDPLSAAERPTVVTADRALYIYTSGTTGLPKAANVSHHRIMTWSHWFAGMMDIGPDDRMYNCLPMYHSIGGVVATAAALVGGGSVLLRERFSANQFWDDIVDNSCTLFQYIGELCRYLLNNPPNRRERQHRLRLCCGNGLRGDVWKPFVERFAIPQILEFYAATENNFSLFNCDARIGAIGRIPPFLAHRFNVALIKLDDESREPVRDANGLCIRCAPGEAGEAIGEIRKVESKQTGDFEGYTDEAASRRKILHTVFAPGDHWLRSGDMMRKDDKGFFYFVDRIGDTFRWKGENVATSEVQQVISTFPGVIDATVYGVVVPGTEGRAGMATIVAREALDLKGLREHLIAHLPSYACPVFLRVRNHLELTDTFKHKKQDLTQQSYDPTASEDIIYFNDQERQAFALVDSEVFARLQAQKIRL